MQFLLEHVLCSEHDTAIVSKAAIWDTVHFACFGFPCSNTGASASLLLHAEDEEMKEMAQEETEKIRSQMQTLEAQLEILLLPKDPLDERSIMLEVLYRVAVCARDSTLHLVCFKL